MTLFPLRSVFDKRNICWVSTYHLNHHLLRTCCWHSTESRVESRIQTESLTNKLQLIIALLLAMEGIAASVNSARVLRLGRIFSFDSHANSVCGIFLSVKNIFWLPGTKKNSISTFVYIPTSPKRSTTDDDEWDGSQRNFRGEKMLRKQNESFFRWQIAAVKKYRGVRRKVTIREEEEENYFDVISFASRDAPLLPGRCSQR